jgi:hypothetical protein
MKQVGRMQAQCEEEVGGKEQGGGKRIVGETSISAPGLWPVGRSIWTWTEKKNVKK